MTGHDTTGFREDDPHGGLNSDKSDVNAVVTVNVRAETEERAREMIDGLAGLREGLAEADRFLAGDDYADAHEALYDLAETVRSLLDGNERAPTGARDEADAAALADEVSSLAGQPGGHRLNPPGEIAIAQADDDPRVTAARTLVDGPLPRFDVQLPSHVVTSWYHELRRAAIGLLEVIDGHPAQASPASPIAKLPVADTKPASLNDLGLTSPTWRGDDVEYANLEYDKPGNPLGTDTSAYPELDGSEMQIVPECEHTPPCSEHDLEAPCNLPRNEVGEETRPTPGLNPLTARGPAGISAPPPARRRRSAAPGQQIPPHTRGL